MKLVRSWWIKRPSGTRPFLPTNPAMNRRATFNHSSGMAEFLNAVNLLQGYASISIINPLELIYGDAD